MSQTFDFLSVKKRVIGLSKRNEKILFVDYIENLNN